MIPEIGHFALILALTMALAQSVLPRLMRLLLRSNLAALRFWQLIR